MICLLLTLIVLLPSGDARAAGTEVTLHIYKLWSDVDTYALTYNANGGDNDSVPPPQSAYAGTSVRVSDIKPTRVDYIFLGWSADSTAAIPELGTGDEILMDSNKTLFALWEPEVTTFTVTFEANGGVPVPATQTVVSGGQVLKPASPQKDEYILFAWYAASDFSGNPWDFDFDVVTEDMILYARWLSQV